MLTLGLIPLFGVAIAALAGWYIGHSTQARCKEIRAEADERVRDQLRRAKDLDAKFVEDVLIGSDIDESIDVFTKNRTAVYTLSSNTPALWEADDLKKAADAEVKNQTAALCSRGRLVSISICTVLFLAVASVEAVLYSQLSTTQPVLSPQVLPKKSLPPSASVTP